MCKPRVTNWEKNDGNYKKRTRLKKNKILSRCAMYKKSLNSLDSSFSKCAKGAFLTLNTKILDKTLGEPQKKVLEGRGGGRL